MTLSMDYNTTLNETVGQIVTAIAPVWFPLHTRFKGILQLQGKPEEGKYRVMDPDDSDYVYLEFHVSGVQTIEQTETGLLIRLHTAF
jgi:hypothetical protein